MYPDVNAALDRRHVAFKLTTLLLKTLHDRALPYLSDEYQYQLQVRDVNSQLYGHLTHSRVSCHESKLGSVTGLLLLLVFGFGVRCYVWWTG